MQFPLMTEGQRDSNPITNSIEAKDRLGMLPFSMGNTQIYWKA